MNADINQHHARRYSLEDQLTYWRQVQTTARASGDKPAEQTATDELQRINLETTAANCEALNAAENERRRTSQKIEEFIRSEDEGDRIRNPDGSWSEG